MSKEKTSNEEELNRAFWLGISRGWKDGAEYLKNRASDYFKNGQDSEANLLRDLSYKFEYKSNNCKPIAEEGGK